jgi:hypothetical protein
MEWTWNGIAGPLVLRGDSKKVADNTVARWATVDGERNGCIVIRLHQTDIVTLAPPTDDIPVIQVNTGGRWSVTTMERVNRVLSADHGAGMVGFLHRDATYTVAGPLETVTSDYGHTYSVPARSYHYAAADGMVIDVRPGETYGHPLPGHRVPLDRNGNLLRYAGTGPVAA